MAKTLWFAHSSDMRLSSNCVQLRRVEGIEGYGIYMAILEIVTSSVVRPIYNDSNEFYVNVAWEIRSEAAKVKRIVEDYGLFYWSPAEGGGHVLSSVGIDKEIQRFREQQNARAEHARKAAEGRWRKKNAPVHNGDTMPLTPESCPSNAQASETNARALPEHTPNNARACIYKYNNNNNIDSACAEATAEKNISEKNSHEKETVAQPPLKKKDPAADFIASLPEEWQSVFGKWVKYKCERGQSYKSTATLSVALKRLRDLSGNNPQTAAMVIEQSIANNYAGLFALKSQKTPPVGLNPISQWN